MCNHLSYNLQVWAGRDLNPRRQSQWIYSPPPLTTRTPTLTPQPGFEPGTNRLTVDGSTAELLWNEKSGLFTVHHIFYCICYVIHSIPKMWLLPTFLTNHWSVIINKRPTPLLHMSAVPQINFHV